SRPQPPASQTTKATARPRTKSTPRGRGAIACPCLPRSIRRPSVSDLFPSTSTPIYADRNSGEGFPDATGRVNADLKRSVERAEAGGTGGPPSVTLDESGYAQLQRGSATIGINVLSEQGVLMVFSPIMAVPLTRREAFYRRLLELSFVATSDAAFA